MANFGSFVGSFCGKALLVGAACFLFRAAPDLAPTLAADPTPMSLLDGDGDGLPDKFEKYLAQACSLPELLTSDVNADTDGDGQPDGFEYCLSRGSSIVTPGLVWPVEPRITLGSHQEDDQLVITVYVIPGTLADIQGFHFVAAVPSADGAPPTIVDLTELFVVSVQQIGMASYGPYTMAIYQVRIPVYLVRLNSGMAIAAVATVAGVPTGDAGTYTCSSAIANRWVYVSNKSGGTTVAQGQAQPQAPTIPDGSTPNMVCGTIDIQEPTGTPGVLQSIVVSIGCAGGNWSCPAGVCSGGGSGGKPKVILDVGSLFD